LHAISDSQRWAIQRWAMARRQQRDVAAPSYQGSRPDDMARDVAGGLPDDRSRPQKGRFLEAPKKFRPILPDS